MTNGHGDSSEPRVYTVYEHKMVYVEEDGTVDLSGLNIQPGLWNAIAFPERQAITMTRETDDEVAAQPDPHAPEPDRP